VDKNDSRTLRLEDGFQAIDFLIKNNQGNRGPLEIIFVGGEPLLEWEKIKKFVVYAKTLAERLKVPLGTTGFPTNGLLLNEKILDFCRKEQMKVAVSADGLANKRNTVSGENSYLELVRKIPLLLRYKDVVRMRLTVHPDYVDQSAEVFEYFLKKGFLKVDIQPVIGVDWPTEKRKQYLKRLDESFRATRKANDRGERKIDIEHLQGYAREEEAGAHCPKGAEEFLVDVDGTVYPCEFFLSVPLEERKKYSLGHVSREVDFALAEKFEQYRLCGDEGAVGVPNLKKKCSACRFSKACFKFCLGYNVAERKFDPKVAQSNWRLSRDIEKVCLKYGDLL
jgi:uncharacterized protein